MSNCLINVGYNDDFGDTITIKSAWDIADFGGDDVRVPAAGNLEIVEVSGNTTCTVGGSLPCDIKPILNLPGEDPITAGKVVFAQNTYVIQTDDPNPLPDQGNVVVADNCNIALSNCNDLDNQQQFTAEQALVDGCVPGDPVECPDGEECNTDPECNPASGVCESDPTPGVPCEDTDGSLCTDPICNDDGVCEQEAEVVECEDGEECNTDPECNPASGVCESDPTPGVPCENTDGSACTDPICNDAGECDQEAEVVTCDDETCQECDPADGECVDKSPLPDECTPMGCATRTPGYWPNHPDESQVILDEIGPLTNCGADGIDSSVAVPNGTVQEMCMIGRSADRKDNKWANTSANLRRHCMAANLNFALSDYVLDGDEVDGCSDQLADATRVCVGGDQDGASCGYEEDGYCASDTSPDAYCSAAVDFEVLAYCCNGTDSEVSVCEAAESGGHADTNWCLGAVSGFNESDDTFPLDGTDICDETGVKDSGSCRADSGPCKSAASDGIINDNDWIQL